MQPQVLRLTTPRLKSTPGAPFAQDDRFVEERAVVRVQPQVLRLTTPRLKSTPGAPFAQDDKQKQKQVQKQPQVLRLTTPRLKSAPGAPFAQDDKLFWCCASVARMTSCFCAALLSLRMTDLWRSDEPLRPKSKDLRLLFNPPRLQDTFAPAKDRDRTSPGLNPATLGSFSQ